MAALRPHAPVLNRRGFTLLELVLVIVVIGILGTAVAPIALSSLKANDAILRVASTIDKQRYANDRLAFEIRELVSGSITTMSPTSLSFSRVEYGATTTTRVVTIDQGPLTSADSCSHTVTLNYNTPVITSVNPPAYTPVLTDRVCSLAFAYYDLAGVPTATAANVRYVEFALTLQTSANGQSYSQRTRIALRNP